MKFMVWVMCAMSSHFTRQIRRVAIRAAVNDVLQGSTWSFTAFHKSVPTSFRRESLKRNHGNYMFAQGKWNRTFPFVFSSLPSFFWNFLYFVALTNDIPHLLTGMERLSILFILTVCPSTELYLLTCGALKKISKTQVRETNLTARCQLQNALLLKAFSGCAHYINSWN